jgi:hypothetical protein
MNKKVDAFGKMTSDHDHKDGAASCGRDEFDYGEEHDPSDRRALAGPPEEWKGGKRKD